MFYIDSLLIHQCFKDLIYKKYGFYNENYQIAADFEFYLRLFLVNKINYKFTDSTYVVMIMVEKYFSFKSNLVSKEILSSLKILKFIIIGF